MLNTGTSTQVPHVKCWNVKTSAACYVLEHQHKCRMLDAGTRTQVPHVKSWNITQVPRVKLWNINTKIPRHFHVQCPLYHTSPSPLPPNYTQTCATDTVSLNSWRFNNTKNAFSFRIHHSHNKWKMNYSWTAWPTKMGPRSCPETSVINYKSTLRDILAHLQTVLHMLHQSIWDFW
jgi:hypothetical protein